MGFGPTGCQGAPVAATGVLEALDGVGAATLVPCVVYEPFAGFCSTGAGAASLGAGGFVVAAWATWPTVAIAAQEAAVATAATSDLQRRVDRRTCLFTRVS
jgi:hypothetical protein